MRVITVCLISLILILAFGLYVGLIPIPGTSDVHFHLYSDSPITEISVSLVPEPSQCVYPFGGVCDANGPHCNLPSNFCSFINTQSKTDAFTFKGVKEGHYWLEIWANAGSNGSSGTLKPLGNGSGGTVIGIFVEGLVTYYVTANLSAGLGAGQVSITSAISW